MEKKKVSTYNDLITTGRMQKKSHKATFSLFNYLSSLSNPFQKGIEVCFFSLFFLLPLTFFPSSSELFEFNKMFLVYIVVTLVIALWSIDMVRQGKFIFKRTLLDAPILFFLTSQFFSTLFSIDIHTSLLGYYSRWNGGLISLVSYSVLYWAFVTYMNDQSLKKIVKAVLVSSTVVSVWGVLEHFGRSPSCLLITGSFDVNCWIQDVALRVFATFGQPNWLAAWLVAVLPISWFYLSTSDSIKKTTTLYYGGLSLLFFVTLLFTKSRSGFLAFILAFVVFWSASIYPFIKTKTKNIPQNLWLVPTIHTMSLLIVIALLGTPFTPSFPDKFLSEVKTTEQSEAIQGPALETGGTESGVIRKIVWEGALNVWQQYPIFGSGVETFAYSYYQGRPLAHNMTSEWNFLYNKAHNEYLNYLATTGIVGLGSYLALIGATVLLFIRPTKGHDLSRIELLLRAALLSSYLSILVTNFFGFSVVATNLLLFMLPAFYMSSQKDSDSEVKKSSNLLPNKALLLVITLFTFFTLYKVTTYWYADYMYADAISARNQENYNDAFNKIAISLSLNPNEAIYHDFLAQTLASVAVGIFPDDPVAAQKYAEASLEELEKTRELAPHNVKLLKSEINTLSDLSDIDDKHLLTTRSRLTDLRRLAPTDPSPIYQLGLTYAKLGMTSEAIDELNAVLLMKPDYKIARRLIAFLYREQKNTEKSREHLEYILKYISPNDVDVQKELQDLNK